MKIVLHYADDMPAIPVLRRIEQLARADRRSVGCRFGEPCDPHKLRSIYDVEEIVESYEDYQARWGLSVEGAFIGLERWSGITVCMPNGDQLILVNPDHVATRRNLTIAHEFGHLALGHSPVALNVEEAASNILEVRTLEHTRYSDEQEYTATAYGLAVLLPYAALLQMLRQGATVLGIAHHYGVSTAAVEMRLKTTGLWGLRPVV